MVAVSLLLEQAALPVPSTRLGRALGAAWEGALGRTVVRRLVFPPGLRVVAVGGATFGGSGKTPLAIACARELARAAAGLRVAIVGHAYRGNPGRARVVGPTDALAEVGDEALLAARALGDRGCVVVGPTRQAAIDLAATMADVVVLDGVTQTAPVRASLALLAVDPDEPWGRARAVPPWGDLRAPVARLLDAVDGVVAVGDGEGAALPEGAWRALAIGRGAHVGGELLSWEVLAGARVGLLCALARPDRVVRSLRRHGVRPSLVVRGRDHGPLPHPKGHVDLWLATPKCGLHASRFGLSAPLATLEHRVELGGGVAAALTAVAQGHNLETSRNVSQIAVALSTP
jgi:tetraacyldisaccharide 4'-kinase